MCRLRESHRENDFLQARQVDFRGPVPWDLVTRVAKRLVSTEAASWLLPLPLLGIGRGVAIIGVVIELTSGVFGFIMTPVGWYGMATSNGVGGDDVSVNEAVSERGWRGGWSLRMCE